MRRARSIGIWFAAVLAFAPSAMAAGNPPFVGKWAFEGSRACQPGAGDNDLALTVTAKTVEYYASSCTILSTRRLSRSGGNVHRFKLRCSGEGVVQDRELVLAVLEKTGQRADLLIHIEPAEWAVTSYQRCSN
jgi:hypothetical protein